jgi:hypothetical protein
MILFDTGKDRQDEYGVEENYNYPQFPHPSNQA